MPSRRQSKQPASHSIDLGNQSADDAGLGLTMSPMLSNGGNEKAKEEDKAGELSASDVKAIALLVVLCEWLHPLH